VKSAVRRNLPVIGASAFAVLALVGLASALAFRAYDQRNLNSRICQSNVQNRAALRLVLETARDQGLATVEDPATREGIVDFYDSLLARIPRIECRQGEPVEVR
jgi:hypothetical protein